MRQVAELNYHKSHYAAKILHEINGYEVDFDKPFFNEFIIRCPIPAKELNKHLLEHGIIGGFDLGQVYSGLDNYMLIATTEMIKRSEIEYLAEVMSEVRHD